MNTYVVSLRGGVWEKEKMPRWNDYFFSAAFFRETRITNQITTRRVALSSSHSTAKVFMTRHFLLLTPLGSGHGGALPPAEYSTNNTFPTATCIAATSHRYPETDGPFSRQTRPTSRDELTGIRWRVACCPLAGDLIPSPAGQSQLTASTHSFNQRPPAWNTIDGFEWVGCRIPPIHFLAAVGTRATISGPYKSRSTGDVKAVKVISGPYRHTRTQMSSSINVWSVHKAANAFTGDPSKQRSGHIFLAAHLNEPS